MRIWDINPGYLNRNSLLGEHRELHAIVSIILNNKKGYSKHPETLRWSEFGWALKKRHDLLSSEMALRGYNDRTPVTLSTNEGKWPDIYIDSSYEQFNILKKKYIDKEPGRIPFPKSAQELWSHHKYSVMARDYNLYKQIGKDISSSENDQEFNAYAELFVNILRQVPGDKSMRNTIQHMWGYVSKFGKITGKELYNMNQLTMLNKIQVRAVENKVEFLMNSTALSELKIWL